MGSEAVLALMLKAKLNEQPVVIAIKENKTCYIPLEESVKKTQMINKAIEEKNFKLALEMRSPVFMQNLETYIKMSKLEVKVEKNLESRDYVLGVMNVGSPASGVNSVVRSFVRHAFVRNCRVLGIQDGFEGLVKGLVKELDWKTVYGWTGIGGSLLGLN